MLDRCHVSETDMVCTKVWVHTIPGTHDPVDRAHSTSAEQKGLETALNVFVGPEVESSPSAPRQRGAESGQAQVATGTVRGMGPGDRQATIVHVAVPTSAIGSGRSPSPDGLRSAGPVPGPAVDEFIIPTLSRLPPDGGR